MLLVFDGNIFLQPLNQSVALCLIHLEKKEEKNEIHYSTVDYETQTNTFRRV